jgi:predicted RNA-binding Zn ribbon-like protein
MGVDMEYTGDVTALDPLRDRLCLDFINTSGQHPSHADDEFLTSYRHLVEWSAYMGVLREGETAQLLTLAERRPAEAEAALHYAVAVRETLFRVLSAAAADVEPDTADMIVFNSILAKTMAHLRMGTTPGGFGWAWAMDKDDLEQMLWPLVWDTVQLMTSHELHHVRSCASDDCDWLFLDTSKNHSRRWCSMSGCGNRAKARSHYHRARKANV